MSSTILINIKTNERQHTDFFIDIYNTKKRHVTFLILYPTQRHDSAFDINKKAPLSGEYVSLNTNILHQTLPMICRLTKVLNREPVG